MTHASKQLVKREEKKRESEAKSSKESSADGAKGTIRIFVYGSLKEGQGNNALLQQVGAKFLGFDSITGSFRMVSFGVGFPGVVHSDPEIPIRTIFGEVYATNEEGLACLDLLESHPSWYERFKYRTDVLDLRAWMYTLPRGKGYLSSPQYNGVDACIWHPRKAELKFWRSRPNIETTSA